jgi:hypothetical protein
MPIGISLHHSAEPGISLDAGLDGPVIMFQRIQIYFCPSGTITHDKRSFIPRSKIITKLKHTAKRADFPVEYLPFLSEK